MSNRGNKIFGELYASLVSKGRKYIWYFLAELSNFLAPMLAIIILSRTIDPTDFGIAALFVSLATTISSFIMISGVSAVSRMYFLKDTQDIQFETFFFNALILNFGIFLLFVFFIIPVYWFDLIQIPLIALALLPFTSLCIAVKSYLPKIWNLQQLGRHFFIFNFGFAVCSIIWLILFAFYFFDGWRIRIYSVAVAEFLFFAVCLFLLFKNEFIRIKVNINYIKQIILYGLPLILHSAGLMFLGTADKLILAYLGNLSSLAIYSVALAYSSFLSLVIIPVDNITKPILFNMFMNFDKEAHFKYICIFLISTFFIGVCGTCLFLMCDFIFPIFVGEKYSDGKSFVGLLILGQFFNGIYRYWTKAIFFSKDTQLIPFITVPSGVLGCVICALLVPIYGIEGAVLGFLAGSAGCCVIAVFLSLRVRPIDFKFVFMRLFKLRSFS